MESHTDDFTAGRLAEKAFMMRRIADLHKQGISADCLAELFAVPVPDINRWIADPELECRLTLRQLDLSQEQMNVLLGDSGVRRLSEVDMAICDTQRCIYQYMAGQGFNMGVFSAAFLQSDFCRRAFDTGYSRFQLETAEESADFFMPEIESKLNVDANGNVGKVAEAGWIGMMYRVLCFQTGLDSAELSRRIPYDKIKEFYEKLYEKDPEVAAEIIWQEVSSNKVGGV